MAEGKPIEEWIIRNLERYRNCSISKSQIKAAGGEERFLALLREKGLNCKLEVMSPIKGPDSCYSKTTSYIVEMKIR